MRLLDEIFKVVFVHGNKCLAIENIASLYTHDDKNIIACQIDGDNVSIITKELEINELLKELFNTINKKS